MTKLKKYKAKRDFKKTPEPAGRKNPESAKRGLIFVVQKHRATQLHYDFRLEMDGVLRSWAVPKGPSRNSNIRRLAMTTEDHPLEYAKFHGTIPKGNYGAGKVEIWDKGTYVPLKVYKDTIEFELFGKKLKGFWVLFAIDRNKKAWILKKMKK